MLTFICNCASIQTYGASRAADLADIITLSAETHLYGVQLKAGPINAGVSYTEKAHGVGLRAGTIGRYKAGDSTRDWSMNGNSFLILNGSYHEPDDKCRGQVDKGFHQSNATPFVLYDFEGYNGFVQIEAGVGLFVGLRVGANLAEVFDFLAGLFTLDPLGDDCRFGSK